MIPLELPVDPSAEEARDWLARELARPEYARGRDLLADLLAWLNDALGDRYSASGNPTFSLVVVLTLLLAIIAAILVWGLRARRVAKAQEEAAPELVDARITPEQYLAAAQEAFLARDWDAALIASFRATVADLDRRAILGEQPGRTALEVARVMAVAFPDAAPQIHAAAGWFDVAAYGMAIPPRVTADQAGAVMALGAHLRATTPAVTS